MLKKINSLFHVVSIYAALIGIIIFYYDGTGSHYFFSIILFFSYPAFLLTKRGPSILFILLHSGVLLSTYLPVISLFISGGRKYVICLLITVLLFLIFPKSSFDFSRVVKPFKQSRAIYGFWAITISLATLFAVAAPIGPYSAAAFYGFFGISLVALEYELRSEPTVFRAGFLVATQSIIVFIFFQFMWTGGGRILMGSIVMMFVGIIHHYKYFNIRFAYVIALGPSLIFLGHYLRYGFDRPFELHSGSVGTPIINSYDLLTNEARFSGKGLSGFVDQLLLFYFNWFPRAAWENKPSGLGYTMVDDLFGRIGVSDEHSTAPGFIGEVVWFFERDFWFGAALSLAAFLLTLKAINKASFGNVAPSVIFISFTANFLWGGLASVGARVWFFLLPALVFIWFVEFVRSRGLRGKNHS